MGAIAQPDYDAWLARYPEFGGTPPRVSADLYGAYFTEATLYHANDGSGPVLDAGQQGLLLNMIAAHLASLNALGPDGQAASTLNGPITSATEGSVSVGSGLIVEAGTAGWYQQTKYGYAYLAATAAYRSARYVPGRARGPSAIGVGLGYARVGGW